MRGVVTFMFDDGYEHILRNVVPLLESHGFKGVFAVPLDDKSVSASEKMTVAPWREWLPVKDKGHELASHSVTHANLTKLNSALLELELAEPQEKIGATTLVYPGGAYDDRLVAVAKKYYRAARTLRRGFESLPPEDPMRLATFNYSRRNFSLLKANTRALWAWITGAWLIETYHVVDNGPTEKTHVVTMDDFEKHLRFIKRLPLANMTVREVVGAL